MNARSASPVASALALLLLLSACGNKGPLVLAEPPAPIETMPTAPGAVPVIIDPPITMPDPETEGALRDPTSANPLLVDPVTGPPPAAEVAPIDPATVPDATDEGDTGDAADAPPAPPPEDDNG